MCLGSIMHIDRYASLVNYQDKNGNNCTENSLIKRNAAENFLCRISLLKLGTN